MSGRRRWDRRRWDGRERRESQFVPRGRLVYSRGPIVEMLAVACAVAGIASVVGLVLSLTALSDRITTAQEARQHSAFDTCRLFRIAVGVAARQTQEEIVVDFRGKPIGRLLRVGAALEQREIGQFFQQTGLSDCHRYAVNARNGKIVVPSLSGVAGGGSREGAGRGS